MRPDSAADAPARPPTVRQLEARALRTQKTRRAAWLKVGKARAALCEALNDFEEDLGRENAAWAALCAARQGRAPEPAPPAPETLTAVEEED
jgi:hypothetical protein